jgi:putative oxidoreductase
MAAISPLLHTIAGPLASVQLAAAGAALLLLAGLWTPVAGVLMAIAEVFLAFSHPSVDPWRHILLGTLGTALAMLGPGAWSVDARLYGRKRIRIPQR